MEVEVTTDQDETATLAISLDDEHLDSGEIAGASASPNPLLGSEIIVVETNGELDLSGRTNGGDDRTPKKGMVFKSYEEVLNFFKRYALRVGFGVCVKKSSFTKAGLCRRLVLVCNKWGNGKDDACYQARPTAKTNCQVSVVARMCDDGLLHLTDVVLEHNHTLNPSAARFLRCYKTLPSGMSKDLVVRAARGEYPSSGDVEVAPFDEWGRLKLEEGDVDAINQFFAGAQMKQPDFFFVMDFYVEGRLRSLFWADSKARAAAQYFGDVVWIDTTCLRNKFDLPLVSFVGTNSHGQLVLLGCGLLSDESTESFLWLLRSWLSSMKGHSPDAVITDEGKAIKAAVRELFPKVRHRICLSDVMTSISERIGGLVDIDIFKKDLEVLLHYTVRGDEFEDRWTKLIDRFGLVDNEWLAFLYENRHFWVPAFLKDAFWAGLSPVHPLERPSTYFEDIVDAKTTVMNFLSNYLILAHNKYEMEMRADFESKNLNRVLISSLPMENHLSKIYTLNMFTKFQDELKAIVKCSIQTDGMTSTVVVVETVEYNSAEEGIRMVDRNYEVLYSAHDGKAECSCGFFHFTGILCRHSLAVLQYQQVAEIPSRNVLNRWKNDVKQLYALNRSLKEVSSTNNCQLERYDYISMQCLRLVEIASSSEEKFQLALKLVKNIRETLLDDNTCREMEQKLSAVERSFTNGDTYGTNQPVSSDGNPQPRKRRGRPPKKSKDTSMEIVLNDKEPIIGSTSGIQKDVFNSSAPANYGAHIRTDGAVDLMEDVNPSNLSFENSFVMQPNSQQLNFGYQMQPGNTLQFGQPQDPRMQQQHLLYQHPVYQDHPTMYVRRPS